MNYDLSSIKLKGKPLSFQPKNLFIPPEALEVYLEVFEGPLDVLLYLIKKQDLDLNNLPLLLIINQYLEYINNLPDRSFKLAANYLVMSATLLQMKSYSLLPAHKDNLDLDEEDPSLLLLEQLKEYKKVTSHSKNIDALLRVDRDIFLPNIVMDADIIQPVFKTIDMDYLDQIMLNIAGNNQVAVHKIELDSVSVADVMNNVLQQMELDIDYAFEHFVDSNNAVSKIDVLVLFLAILELCLAKKIVIFNSENSNEFMVKLTC